MYIEQKVDELSRKIEEIERLVVGMPRKETFTLSEAASVLRVSYFTIRRWARSGKILAETPDGKHYRISREEINRYASEGPRRVFHPKLEQFAAHAEASP